MWRGVADKEWTVLARRVLVRQGLADLDRKGTARAAGHGKERQTRNGSARLGQDR